MVSSHARRPSPNPSVLEPIVVTATRSATSLAEVPAAVSVIDQSDIQLGLPTVGFEEPLNRIPVFLRRIARTLRKISASRSVALAPAPLSGCVRSRYWLTASRKPPRTGKPSSIISTLGQPSGSRFCAGLLLLCTAMHPEASSTSSFTPFLETRLMGGRLASRNIKAKTGGQAGKRIIC